MINLNGINGTNGNHGPEVRIIKRYQNRKLYDTLQSRYITLDELAKIIRLGIDIKVLDNKSHSDITYQTMLQLIFEMERKAEGMENVTQTMRVIRFADGLLSSYLTWLESSLDITAHEKELRPRIHRPTWSEQQPANEAENTAVNAQMNQTPNQTLEQQGSANSL